jgi:hypothetical protein
MDHTEGFFDTSWQRGLNVFVFFTIQSNIIVGVTTAMLALAVARPSSVFRVLRLIGVVAISITFIVFHVALRELQDLTGQAAVADVLLHTVSPVLCVVGWLVFGPRRQTSTRVVMLTLVFLLWWGSFTMIRGGIIEWWPYPFIDPTDSGYARVVVNMVLIGGVFIASAAAAHWLDQSLTRRAAPPALAQ